MLDSTVVIHPRTHFQIAIAGGRIAWLNPESVKVPACPRLPCSRKRRPVEEIDRFNQVVCRQGGHHRVAEPCTAKHCPQTNCGGGVTAHEFADNVLSRNFRQLFSRPDRQSRHWSEPECVHCEIRLAIRSKLLLQQAPVAKKLQELLGFLRGAQRPEPGAAPPAMITPTRFSSSFFIAETP